MTATTVTPLWEPRPGSSRAEQFEELAAIEPGLARLADAVRAVTRATRRRRTLCANGIWYGYGRDWAHQFKLRMSWLAGWSASRPELKSPDAYSVAYQYLYDLLPDCRRCGCLRL